MSASTTQPASHSSVNLRWRVVDIAVASVVGVASAVIYWLAGLAYSPLASVLNPILPGLDGLMNGLWLFAAPLASLIVRKPGAGIYAEVVAAVLEGLFGNIWGTLGTFLIGLAQGVFAELAFFIFAYRKWTLPVTLLSGFLAGVACWGYSFLTDLQAITITGSYGLVGLGATLVSGVLVSGLLVWYLYVGIAKTGALDQFASGREIRGITD